MAILEKEVLINLNGRNIKYYESKDIPRHADKQGRLKVKVGTEILVKVEDLPKSGVKVTKICDDCGKRIPNQKYDQIILSREKVDGLDRCYECGRIKSAITNKQNTIYEKSLEYFAIYNNKKYLLKEFSEKNIKKPSEISKSTSDVYWWNCPDCKSEYDMPVTSRTNNNNLSNCPFCAGQRINHTNCLWTTHPEVAELLQNPQRGYEISSGTNKKENFKCPDCGNIEKRIIVNMVYYGFSCSKCSDGIPYPEKFMISVLDQLGIEYATQKIFSWSRNVCNINNKLSGNKKYDFYIPSLNIIIETHGRQHYEGGFNFETSKTFEEEIENDALKENLAKENGIEKYIVIDCKYSNLEYIKNSIFSSELSNLFDLTNINWSKCHEFTCNSLVKKASELWNNGVKSTNEISKIMKMSSDTIRKYLKMGSKVNLCGYNPKENKGSLKEAKKIIQLSLDGKFIKEYPSMYAISKELNLHSSQISRCCSGKSKNAHGFIWMYKTNYDGM